MAVPGDYSLGELAVRFGLELRGDPELRVSHVATLAEAEAGSLSFLADSRHRRQLPAARATAVVVGPNDAAACPGAALIGPQPASFFCANRRVAASESRAPAGIHASAIVASGARIAASASVGPLCVIEAGAEIGDYAQVGAGCMFFRRPASGPTRG